MTWKDPGGVPSYERLFAEMESQVGNARLAVADGDVDKALAGAATVLEATYYYPYQLHGSMGPSCAIADVREDEITVWSPTQGVYPLRNAVARMLGYDPARVEVLLYQLVHLTRGGEAAKMSKRRGDVVFLDELLDEVGVDAARWYLVSRGHDQTIEIDVDLAAEKTQKNPVYYVQYAHARIASILRKASDAGLAPADSVAGTLGGGPEGALARAIVRFPEVVEDAVVGEETQGITAYAIELATGFHAFYRDARVVDPAEPARSAARLALARAAQVTLARTLRLLGISAPESM